MLLHQLEIVRFAASGLGFKDAGGIFFLVWIPTINIRNHREDDCLTLEDRPDYPLAHYHLARILANQGKYDEAIMHLLKALKPEDDRTPSYLFALGATYARAGDRDRALAYLRQAREVATRRGQQQLLSGIEQALAELEH